MNVKLPVLNSVFRVIAHVGEMQTATMHNIMTHITQKVLKLFLPKTKHICSLIFQFTDIKQDISWLLYFNYVYVHVSMLYMLNMISIFVYPFMIFELGEGCSFLA